MKEVLIKLLQGIIDDLDAGNSNLTEEETLKVVKVLKKYSRRDMPMSKYQAYTYIGKSRATFDNLVKEGKIPEGVHTAGYKEKSWFRKDLDKYIKDYATNRKNSNTGKRS